MKDGEGPGCEFVLLDLGNLELAAGKSVCGLQKCDWKGTNVSSLRGLDINSLFCVSIDQQVGLKRSSLDLCFGHDVDVSVPCLGKLVVGK